eukprot:Gregarina_sp_Pseudo_9__3955@NODE_40_length_5278_cov_10_517465_g37_i0_p3_GENE_NODE_40_length_5278_cov_10_517465_g37_i0NODE_40_length_5278_cov_10_517465_g37_i0_p3_ORF_typecomplete_len410_score69_46DMT_YdcZ/PF04657_13/3_1e09DMT_YdcZ/PF04657_13/1_3e08_NODE_40_length_5278_cov_10_517465_g37_i037594988
MPENRTQTCLAAWPTPAELGYPLWLLNSLPWFCGIVSAVTLAAAFRLAVIWESIWWSAAASALSGLWIAWLTALIIPGASLSRALRGAVSGVKRNWSICFMLLGGPFLALGVTGVIVSVRHIGIGCCFVFFCLGALLSSLYVDSRGIGWNSRHPSSLLYIPGCLLFIFGLCLMSHSQILSAHECVTSLEGLAIFGTLTMLAGSLLPLQNAANGEIEKFLGTPWRAATFGLFLASTILVPLALYMDGQVTLFTNMEVWILLLMVGLGLAVLLSLGLLIAPQLGSVKSSGWSIFAFSGAAVPLYYFELTSLPPRVLDVPTCAGLGVLFLASLILHWGSTRAQRRNRVTPSKVDSDPSCEICVRNDQELFVACDEYDLEQWAPPGADGDTGVVHGSDMLPDAQSPSNTECRV